MTKQVIGLMLILLLALGASTCDSTGLGKMDNDNIPENTDTSEEITANNVHIENGEYILFSGYSKLPEGTYLQTQLYSDGQPEAWWPADKYIKVRNGKWQISVRLGENGAPEALLVGPTYVFKVWEKDNPSVMATFPFDLTPPPGEK